MKTDLSKILSISGMSGLYTYISQAKAGAIVENLATGKRTCIALSNKISSLEDISIYTDEDDVKLSDVFLRMKETLAGEPAPSHKSDPAVLKGLFEKALPNYDRDRFYVSHMKKVVEWYTLLENHASLDFVTDEDRESAASND